MGNPVIRLGQEVGLTFFTMASANSSPWSVERRSSAKRDLTSDGKVENEAKRPCPRVCELQGSAGEWVSRDPPLVCRVDAEIIFARRRADGINEAAVYAQNRSDHPLFRFDLLNRRATEPTTAA